MTVEACRSCQHLSPTLPTYNTRRTPHHSAGRNWESTHSPAHSPRSRAYHPRSSALLRYSCCGARLLPALHACATQNAYALPQRCYKHPPGGQDIHWARRQPRLRGCRTVPLTTIHHTHFYTHGTTAPHRETLDHSWHRSVRTSKAEHNGHSSMAQYLDLGRQATLVWRTCVDAAILPCRSVRYRTFRRAPLPRSATTTRGHLHPPPAYR